MVAGSTSGPENQNKPQLFLTPLVHTRANRNLRPPIGIADFYRSPLFIAAQSMWMPQIFSPSAELQCPPGR